MILFEIPQKRVSVLKIQLFRLMFSATDTGVASYGALGHVPPQQLYFWSLWSQYESQPMYCVVCEISWCRCQQLTALSISTALVTTLLVIEQLLHPALKSTVSAHDIVSIFVPPRNKSWRRHWLLKVARRMSELGRRLFYRCSLFVNQTLISETVQRRPVKTI